MFMQNIVITGIDNALANCERRRRAAFKEVYGKVKGIDIAQALRGLSPLLTEEQEKQFYAVFMSEKYIDLDKPVPHSSGILKNLHKNSYTIVYLTARNYALREKTIEWLGNHKFPLPDRENVYLFMKDGSIRNDSSTDSYFIEKRLGEINEMGNIVLGVASSLAEVAVFSNFGVRPVVLEASKGPAGLNVSLENTTVVKSWKEIESFLKQKEKPLEIKESQKTAEEEKKDGKNTDFVTY